MMGLSRLSAIARSVYASSLDWLFPPRCSGCGKLGEIWCQECRGQVELIRQPYCQLCGSPKAEASDCSNCGTWEYSFHGARAWGRYSGTLRKAILSLKKRHNVQLGFELSKGIAQVLADQTWQIDLIESIPLAPHRLAQRGYNQAELLARPLASATGLRHAGNLLSRRHETVKQFELHAAQRWENLLGAFHVETTEAKGASILLVDDIMTTGATLNAAAVALLKAGARQVYGLTLAKTLLDDDC
jgi:ComF family protein